MIIHIHGIRIPLQNIVSDIWKCFVLFIFITFGLWNMFGVSWKIWEISLTMVCQESIDIVLLEWVLFRAAWHNGKRVCCLEKVVVTIDLPLMKIALAIYRQSMKINDHIASVCVCVAENLIVTHNLWLANIVV